MESLPCPAPAPLPPPRWSPDPAVALTPERGGILRREPPERPGPRHVRFRMAEPSQEPPGTPPLAAPLPHSSLALGAEVRAARRRAFDGRRAAERLVRRSFVARCAADARVGEGLNIPRDQQLYQGLVSLRVPADEVLHSAVREKLALVQYQPGDRKEAAGGGPDLRAFYRPEELFTETPFLEVGGLPPLKRQPRRRPPDTAFLMYRKRQQWAG